MTVEALWRSAVVLLLGAILVVLAVLVLKMPDSVDYSTELLDIRAQVGCRLAHLIDATEVLDDNVRWIERTLRGERRGFGEGRSMPIYDCSGVLDLPPPWPMPEIP